jgi:signal transduction histidine kinase
MTSTRLLAILQRAGLDALYLTIGLVTSVLAFAVWVTGLSVSLSLAVFIVGLPIILVTALAFRWTAELDRRNAALVLGHPVRGRYRDHRGERFLARLWDTLCDPQTWRDLAWLVLHSVIGFAFGVAAVSLVAESLALALLPLWYWSIPDGVDWGIINIDTLPEALLVMPLAIPLAAITIGLLRLMALGESKLAAALLAAPAAIRRPGRRVDTGLLWSVYATVAGLAGIAVTVTWALTTQGSFWPGWVWLGLALAPALRGSIHHAVASTSPGRRRGLAVHGAISGVIGVASVIAWMLTDSTYFWAIWVLIGLAAALALHAVILSFWDRLSSAREQALVDRVDVLTRTRRGALDVQAVELRRIERDLHDGAQARLVALSMQLGRAEERLEGDPEVADLVRAARGEASAAIAELRDLARGIAPPVLADRGLAAAAEALARRSAIPATVDAQLDRRPVPVIETAAYFVVAEALTNAAKHAGGAPARVTIRHEADRLIVEVTDEGPGGADAGGSGLTGLRHRVEALDGRLTVTSPPGAGTTVYAELPSAG